MEGPSTTLTFLGIIRNAQHMEISLPQEKLDVDPSEAGNMVEEEKCHKKGNSFIGILACCNIPQKWSGLVGHLWLQCM